MALQVSFYHLMLSPVEKVSPRILEKIHAAGLRAVVWVADDQQLSTLNTTLWTYSTLAFIPHGCALDTDGDAISRQPIWLSRTCENPNQSTLCMVTHQRCVTEYVALGFDRIVDIFDATSLGIDADRGQCTLEQRIAYYAGSGADISHWQQTKDGWQKIIL